MDFSMFDNIRIVPDSRRQAESSEENRPVNTSGSMSRFPEHTPLAMAYVPMQQWRDILNCEDALANGTLFGELVLPFYPTPCNNEGCQRRRSI